MTETTRRTLRTLLQTLVGFVLAGGLSEIVAAYADEWRIAGADRLLLAGVLTILVTFAHNWAEEHGAIRPLLKTGPSRPHEHDPPTGR